MCCSFLFRHYFVWKAPVGTLVPMNRRVTVKHTLAILCELSDPFKGWNRDLKNWGIKKVTAAESPGISHRIHVWYIYLHLP